MSDLIALLDHDELEASGILLFELNMTDWK